MPSRAIDFVSGDVPSTLLTDANLAEFARELFDPADTRRIIAIAGIPGSGKTTLMLKLVERLNAMQPHIAAAVSMDGYHLTNVQLDALNLRKVKGSPLSYDVTGYLHLLDHLKRCADRPVFYPIYDRGIHNPIWRALQRIMPETKIIFTEGQFLLLDQAPWDQLADLTDESWYLHVNPDNIREDLIARHVRGGRSRENAEAYVASNDDINRDLVLGCMRRPDRVICIEGR